MEPSPIPDPRPAGPPAADDTPGAAGAAQNGGAEAAAQALQEQLRPWQQAVADPAPAQLQVLQRLLADYARTSYGAGQGADARTPGR